MSDLGAPPVYLVDHPSHLDDAVGLLTPSWRPRRGFALPVDPWMLGERRWCCTGEVGDADDAGAAVRALVRGCALAVSITASDEVADAFVGDAARAGELRPMTSTAPPPADGIDALAADERELLALLAEGRSVADAAAARYLSLRTAHRRLGSARRKLGTATTREAVMTWRRHIDR